MSDLTTEEINILAILMKQAWLDRQINSIEVTRMKYSGADFKMTSQANHLAKLLNLKAENHRENIHAQRLYKRRRERGDGSVMSNWMTLNQSAINDNTTPTETATKYGTIIIYNENHDEYEWEPIEHE